MVITGLTIKEEKLLPYLLLGWSHLLNATVIVQDKEAIHLFM